VSHRSRPAPGTSPKSPGFKVQSSGTCPVPTPEPWTLDLGLQTRGHQSASVPSQCGVLCPVPQKGPSSTRSPVCGRAARPQPGRKCDQRPLRRKTDQFILPVKNRLQNPVFLWAQNQLQRFRPKKLRSGLLFCLPPRSSAESRALFSPIDRRHQVIFSLIELSLETRRRTVYLLVR
jgi:hypothetical protein